MHYSHIFFDWHGVLSHSRFWSHIPEKVTIDDAIFGVLNPMLKEWLEGKCNVNQFVDALAKETNIPAEYLMVTLQKSCESLEFSSDRVPGLIARLRSRGTKCIISTDNFDVFNKWTVPTLKLDLLFDDILNSYDIKHVKPELDDTGYSPFFSPYIEKHSIKSGLILDDNDYSHIAKKLGLDFILIKTGDDIAEILS